MSPLTHYQSSSPSTYVHIKSAKTSLTTPNYQEQQQLLLLLLTDTGDSLHYTPPLLLLLLLGAHAHHFAIVSHGGSGLVHVAFEGAVEPAADQAGRVACHLGVAGAALGVVFAAALVAGQVVEEALGGGGGLVGGISWVWWHVHDMKPE